MRLIFNVVLSLIFISIYLLAILLLGWIAYPMRQELLYIFGLKWYLAQIIIFAGLSFFVASTFIYYQQVYSQKRLLRRQRTQLARLKEIVSAGIEVDYEQLLQNIPPFLMQIYRQDFNIKIDYAAVYFYNAQLDNYKLFSSKTRESTTAIEDCILKTDPLAGWFLKDAPQLIKSNLLDPKYLEAVRYQDVNNYRSFKRSQQLKESLSRVRDSLASLRAQVCVPCFYQDRLLGLFVLGKKYRGVYSSEEVDTFILLAHDIAIAIRSAELRDELQQSYIGAIHAIITALEEKDPYTKGHSERVVKYSVAIAEELKNTFPFTKIANLIDKVRRAALLHDVGKIGVPDSILQKPGKLEKEEFERLKKHPQISINILQSIKNIPEDVKEGIESHHEKYDGTGYAKGAKGHRIPLIARIISIADAYDAMTSDRSYRKAMTPQEAVKEILRCTYYKGPQWDMKVVEAHLIALKKDQNTCVTDELIKNIRLELDKKEKILIQR